MLIFDVSYALINQPSQVASVKNFQLCERNDQDHIMQFGRIEGRHSFTIDYSYPLTPLQAFAIAISSLQSKISFG